MKIRTLPSVVALLLLALPLLAASAPAATATISDAEENFLRGFFDHQWLAIAYDRLAVKQSGKESVRQFAQSELDMYRSLGTQMQSIDKSFGMIDVPQTPGSPAPKLGAGRTREFQSLPAGASWATVSVLGTLAGGGRLDNNTMTLVDDSETLEHLSGDPFDKQYLLRVIMLHQRMLRHALRELQAGTGNEAVLTFARAALAAMNQQNEAAENLYNGRVLPPGPPPAP